jgi:CheY-like chemotaxis protein
MPKVVLLVDDNPIDLMINEKTLQRYDDSVVIFKANSGEQALEMLKSGACNPSCLLLDIKMPTMNGFEFLDALAQTEVEVKFGIHMLSSSIDPSDLQQAEEREVVRSYIEKPLSATKLEKIKL